MKEPRHDDERLAALLEGRLEGPERDELLAYLATADEDFHVFAKTAAVLREMEEEEQATQDHQAGEQVELPPPVRGAVPPSAKSGYRRWKALRVTVPSVLVGLLALTTFTTTRAASLGSPIALAESLDRGDQGLPAGWGPGWTGTRGDDKGGAARAGAFLVQLAVSIQAEDSVQIATLARQIRDRFDKRAVLSSPIVQIQNRAGEPADVLKPLLRAATKRLGKGGKRDYLQLGAWTEAARLAVATKDAEFFRSNRTRTMLQRADRLTRANNQPAQNAVREIRTLLAGDREPDWDALSTQLRTLMNAIAN